MIWIDYVLIGIVVLSVIISVMRGFMREIVSLISWVAAFWISLHFHADVAEHLVSVISSQWVRTAVSFSAVFFAVLLASMLVNLLIGLFMKASKAEMTDRFVGAIFGLIRGGVVVIALMTVVSMTPLTTSEWWRHSYLIISCKPAIERVRAWMPKEAHSSSAMLQAQRALAVEGKWKGRDI